MRFGLVKLALGLGTLFAVTSLHAQAPAGAPAGSNGICKDGTYSNATQKDGACRGHKGVQTWYVASSTAPAAPAAPLPAPTHTAAPAMPPPVPTSSAPTMPTPTPATTAPAAAPATPRASRIAASANRAAIPGGGPGLVWVNTGTNVYHCNGDDVYGKTRAGSYMSEADAKAKGARAARGQVCTGK